MALKSYVITQDFKSPFVIMTQNPRNPQVIKFKQFRKGEVISGEMKHANNKPAFVLVKDRLVVPLAVVKELVTKEISHSAEGNKAPQINLSDTPKTNKVSKVKYIDAILIGAIVGAGGVYLAERKGWIAQPDKMNKLYGAVAGAVLGCYAVYRMKNK